MAVPTYQGTTGGSISSSGIAAQPWVASHATDDIGICMCGTSDATSGTHTTPSGFTLTATNPTGFSTAVTGSAVQLETAYKRATSGAEANAAFTTDIGSQYCKHLLVRGCVTSGNPIEVEADGTATSATTHTITTGLTTTTNDALIILIVANDFDSASAPDTGFVSSFSNANLGTVTKQDSNQWSTNSGLGLHIFTGTLVTAGAVGDWSITFANAGTIAWWCGAMKSSNPSGGGGTTNAGRLALLGVGR